jgi:hypothetical protein
MSGWQDSNLRPPGPKPGAITELRYTPEALCEAEREGFEPSVPITEYDGLANRSFRPLRHLSFQKSVANIYKTIVHPQIITNKNQKIFITRNTQWAMGIGH